MLQPDCNSKIPVDLPNIIPLYYCRNIIIFSDFKPKVSVIKTKQNKKVSQILGTNIYSDTDFCSFKSWKFIGNGIVIKLWTILPEDTIKTFKDTRRHTVHKVQWGAIKRQGLKWDLLGAGWDRNREFMINLSLSLRRWKSCGKSHISRVSYLRTIIGLIGIILNSLACITKDTKRNKQHSFFKYI